MIGDSQIFPIRLFGEFASSFILSELDRSEIDLRPQLHDTGLLSYWIANCQPHKLPHTTSPQPLQSNSYSPKA